MLANAIFYSNYSVSILIGMHMYEGIPNNLKPDSKLMLYDC